MFTRGCTHVDIHTGMFTQGCTGSQSQVILRGEQCRAGQREERSAESRLDEWKDEQASRSQPGDLRLCRSVELGHQPLLLRRLRRRGRAGRIPELRVMVMVGVLSRANSRLRHEEAAFDP